MTLPLHDTVAVIKTKLNDELGMPPGKQKLQIENIFLKDSNSLGFYNVTPGKQIYVCFFHLKGVLPIKLLINLHVSSRVSTVQLIVNFQSLSEISFSLQYNFYSSQMNYLQLESFTFFFRHGRSSPDQGTRRTKEMIRYFYFLYLIFFFYKNIVTFISYQCLNLPFE